MMITRRRFVATATAATAAGLLLPGRVLAEVTLGSGRLTTVSDGHLVLPRSFVLGDLPAGEAEAVVTAAGYAVDGLESPCNLALWQDGDRVVLFDAGSGTGFMPSAGQVLDALDAAGVAPDAVTDVVFTHGHPDHLWGVLDDFDEPLFYNARHHMGAEEHAYWSDPATLDAIGAERQSFAAGAARRLELLGDAMALFGAGDQPVPGVTAVATPGHTPGHLSFRVGPEGATALVIGDAIANGHLAFARPEWESPSDQDPALGRTTRMALLEELSASGETVVGFHFPAGGLGTLARSGDGYAFTPAA